MTTANITPSAGSLVPPGGPFGCIITAVGASEVTIQVTDGVTSEVVWNLTTGFAAGYSGSVSTLSGVTTLNNVRRTAGWFGSPLQVFVTDVVSGVSTTESWTYYIRGIAVYVPGTQPYNEEYDTVATGGAIDIKDSGTLLGQAETIDFADNLDVTEVAPNEFAIASSGVSGFGSLTNSWLFDDSTTTTPASGHFSFDNDAGNPTIMYIHTINARFDSVGGYLFPNWEGHKFRIGSTTANQVGRYDFGAIPAPLGSVYAIPLLNGSIPITFTNGAEFYFDLVGVASGTGGSATWIGLDDTAPTAYTGEAGKFVKVNLTENGLDFGVPAGSGDVLGPATSTPNALAVWDAADGSLLQDSEILGIASVLSLTGLNSSVNIIERSAAPSPTTGYGKFWTKDDAPTTPWFTNDAGDDYRLGGTDAAVTWEYDSSVVVDALPGNGLFHIDNSTPLSGTRWFIDDAAVEGSQLTSLGNVGVGETIRVVNGTEFASVAITRVEDNTGYFAFDIEYRGSSPGFGFTDGDIISFLIQGATDIHYGLGVRTRGSTGIGTTSAGEFDTDSPSLGSVNQIRINRLNDLEDVFDNVKTTGTLLFRDIAAPQTNWFNMTVSSIADVPSYAKDFAGVVANFAGTNLAVGQRYAIMYIADTAGAGTGDVLGSAFSTLNGIPRYSGTTGKTIQESPGLTYLNGQLEIDNPAATLKMAEQAAQASLAGFGNFWVKNDSPNKPMFTDNAGTEHDLTVGGGSGPAMFIQTADPTIADGAVDGDFWIEI